MKKITATLLFLTLGSTVYFAQVGVNTENPRTTFHVDGAKDNPTTGAPTAAQQLNDVVVTSAGRLGVGTNAPANALEVNSGTANVSGIRMTQLKNASVLSTDAAGTVISGNTEFAGVSVTKQRLVVANAAVVLNSGSGDYSFRYSTNTTGGYWQIRVNTGAARQFNIWDTEYNGGTGGGYANVYQGRNVFSITPNVWTSLNDANAAGGANEYNVYHVYDLTSGVILRLTCTLSNISGIRESMIVEEF